MQIALAASLQHHTRDSDSGKRTNSKIANSDLLDGEKLYQERARLTLIEVIDRIKTSR